MNAAIQTNIMYYAQKDGCPNGHSPHVGKICYGCVESALNEKNTVILSAITDLERLNEVLSAGIGDQVRVRVSCGGVEGHAETT